MKIKIVLASLLLGVALSGCGTVQVKILEYPENKTIEQRQLDNIECYNISKVNGPWFFGLGTLIYRHMSKERYINCMESRGYVVDK